MSSVMHQVLRAGLPEAEAFARTQARPSHASRKARSLPLPDAPPAEGLPSRAPVARAPDAVLASLEQLAERTLQESPQLDLAGVQRLVAAYAEVFLGAPPDPQLLEHALARVFSQRPNDPPRPVGGNRPPE